MNKYSEADRIRIFVAVVPPEDALDRMNAFLARLRPLAPYKWVARAQLHITLRFLGEAPREQAERIADALTEIRENAFDLRFNHAGGFPNLARPRVIWLGGDTGAEALFALAARAEAAARKTGFLPETKRFAPHLTVARVKNEGSVPPALLQSLETPPDFSWRCDRFFLIESRLNPSGPVYIPLREYPLTDGKNAELP